MMGQNKNLTLGRLGLRREVKFAVKGRILKNLKLEKMFLNPVYFPLSGYSLRWCQSSETGFENLLRVVLI
jgi:hypothetical protein